MWEGLEQKESALDFLCDRVEARRVLGRRHTGYTSVQLRHGQWMEGRGRCCVVSADSITRYLSMLYIPCLVRGSEIGKSKNSHCSDLVGHPFASSESASFLFGIWIEFVFKGSSVALPSPLHAWPSLTLSLMPGVEPPKVCIGRSACVLAPSTCYLYPSLSPSIASVLAARRYLSTLPC